jgi:hypothetical protein
MGNHSKIIAVSEQQPADIFDERDPWTQARHGVQKYREAVPGVSIAPLVADLTERLARGTADDKIDLAFPTVRQANVEHHLLTSAMKVSGVCLGRRLLHLITVSLDACRLES